MNKPADKKPILVVGGTGKSGRRVAERLKSLGLPIRIGSRTGEPPAIIEYARNAAAAGVWEGKA